MAFDFTLFRDVFFYNGLAARIDRYKMLASFDRDGVSVRDSLSELKGIYSKTKREGQASLYQRWLRRIDNGSSFSDAMKGYIPAHDKILIAAGEANGKLSEGLEDAANLSMNIAKIKSAIVWGLPKPVFLIVGVVGIVVYFSLFMVPMYAEIQDPSEWQGNAAILYSLSQFIVSYGFMVLFFFVLMNVAVFMSVDKYRGSFRDSFLDKIPPYNFYRVYQSSVFLISLASMVKAGISLRDALERIRKLSSPWLGSYIREILRKLDRGVPSGQALSVGMFDRRTLDKIEIYGKRSDFDKNFESIGAQAMEDALENSQRLIQTVFSVILLIGGLVLSWLFWTVFEFSINLQDAMQSGVGA